MSICKACHATNPDAATICTFCRTPLSKPETLGIAGTPGRRQTQVEPATGQPTRLPTVAEGFGVLPPDGAASGTGQPHALAKSPQPSNAHLRRVTIYDPSFAAGPEAQSIVSGSAKPAPASATRKIVGVLVTYSWSDQGQIFPVLEGRNRIGSDPKQCDIAIPQDDTLSAINSHIVFRKNFVIGDEVSMGGTDVDGEPVETAFVPLHNYARIRTGSTHWTFIVLQPPSTDTGGAEAGS